MPKKFKELTEFSTVSTRGAIIKNLCEKQRLKIAQLVEMTGRKRQFFYQQFQREDYYLNEIEWWANILSMTKDELICHLYGNKYTPAGEILLMEKRLLLKTNEVESVKKELEQVKREKRLIEVMIEKQLGIDLVKHKATIVPRRGSRLGQQVELHQNRKLSVSYKRVRVTPKSA